MQTGPDLKVLTLIKNADIYAPASIGVGNLLLGGGKVLYAGKELPGVDAAWLGNTLDLQGAPVIPGLIDCHVHVTGGGGEDGFSTQAPPVQLSRFTRHGVTSVVSLLGTDDETRSTAGLIARTRALREEGLSAWCWTGGYHVPPTTLTGTVRGDIVNIECVIGLGELATPESIIVEWSGGSREQFAMPEIRTSVTLVEGTGLPAVLVVASPDY